MRGAALDALTTQELAQACRIFLDLAYPDGPDTIPANKLPYYTIANDRPHPIAEAFGLNRFAEGRFIDESVAAAVAH